MIGYIPARSGSKRIKSKNLQCLGSHSLVETAVVRAYYSGLNPIFVSSDSKDLLNQIKVRYPFVPLLRDPQFSLDSSSISSSLLSDLDSIVNHKSDPICILQPSNPFCTVESIKQSAQFFLDSSCPSLVSGYSLPFRPYEISNCNINSSDCIIPYKSLENFDSLIFVDGNFCFTSLDHCLEFSSAWSPRHSFIYIQDNQFVIDIDEPSQLLIAKACWSTWLSMHNQSHFYD